MSKFLTKLTQPKLWNGYPFLLSAVIGDLEDDIILIVEGFNVANTLIGAQGSTPSQFTNTVRSFNVNEIYGSFFGIDYLLVHLETALGETLTETIRIDIAEPCANPVYLMGRDSLGGILQWMFDYSQEYEFDYGGGRKAKRLVLTANGLTINEWESLQDFITLGEVYRNSIVEFTSATVRTSTRIGQQVYAVDSVGNKTCVLVIPTKNKTFTRFVKHSFQIEIEYPEVFAA